MLKSILRRLRQDWVFIVIMLVMASVILAICVLYNREYAKKIINNYNDQLITLAHLKSMQITLWRQELVADAQTLQDDSAFSKDIQSFLTEPNNFLFVKEVQDRLRLQLLDPNYSSIFLVNPEGQTLLQVGKMEENPEFSQTEAIHEDSATKNMLLTNPYLTSIDTIRMKMIVPIEYMKDEERPSMVYIIFLINPDSILYPLIEITPGSNKTVETLLVRKEADRVLFLNDLKYVDNTKLQLSLQMNDNEEVPAVMAARGIIGIIDGNDYRGVPVMAAISSIQDSDWKIIAKMDWEEINQPIHEQFLFMLIPSFLLLFAAGISLKMVWNKRSADMSRGLTDSEKKRKVLEDQYTTLFNQANDAIVLVAEDGKIVDANEQAVRLYGYSRDELLSMGVSDLRTKSTQDLVQSDMDQVKSGALNYFETVHKTKSGKMIHVEVSSKYISIGERSYYQSIIRDTTQKMEAQEQLRRSEEDLKKAQKVSHVGSWNWNLRTNQLDQSDEMFAIFGLEKKSGHIDMYEFAQYIAEPDEFERIMRIIENANQTKQLYSYETRIKRVDGEIRDIWVEAGEIDFNEKGEIQFISGIVQDITEKKAVEGELRKRENLLQRIFDLLPVGVWITDNQGNLVRSNKMAKEIFGIDAPTGQIGADFISGRKLPSGEKIKPEDWSIFHAIKERVTIRDELIELNTMDGKTKTLINSASPIIDETGSLEGGIVVASDISELKKAEEQLSTQLNELRRWNLATLGRENRVRELKNEINELLSKQGLPPKYPSTMDESSD